MGVIVAMVTVVVLVMVIVFAMRVASHAVYEMVEVIPTEDVFTGVIVVVVFGKIVGTTYTVVEIVVGMVTVVGVRGRSVNVT